MEDEIMMEMKDIEKLIKMFEDRKGVATRKVDSNYRDDYNKGVAFAYSEVLQDLYNMRK
jgi:hypothetical protein